MKKILSAVLVMMLTSGVFASLKDTGKTEKNSGDKFVVELMSSSPEFTSGDNGTVEISQAFMLTQKGTSKEYFGSFWADFEYKKAGKGANYITSRWNVSDIRLGDNLSNEELKKVKIYFWLN